MKRPRLTIPRRVFLAFALVITVSGVAIATSYAQHQRTVATLDLVHQGYLPLAITVGEARAAQSVFGNLLDRVLTERDTKSTRVWLTDARHARPVTLRKALDGVAAIERTGPPAADRNSLARVTRELRRAKRQSEEGERRYQELYALLDKDDKTGASRVLADLGARERAIEARLHAGWSELLERMEATSARAAEEQRQAVSVLAGLTALALLVGVGVTWWSQRVLSPLPRLQRRVEAVARGDLARQLGPNTDDEIGRLGREFERMVAAIAARDASLQAASESLVRSERLAAIGRMAAHVSHEVRNPLSSIGLNVEILEEELRGSGSEIHELLQAIHREVDHLRVVTDQYLRMARPPKPMLAPESLSDVVLEAVQFYGAELKAAGVELTVDAPDGLPQVGLEEAQIRQVLVNLLKNAREAVGSGGHVRLSVSAADGGVLLRVADDGPGIPEAEREHIFEVFHTTKKHGSGLGLALSQQIIVAHGGTIRCRGGEGGGAVFELWFPAYDAAPDADAAPDQASGRPAA